MTTVQDVLATLESIAPSSHAFSWDKIGLQVGAPEQPVTKAVVSLDRSLAAVEYAKSVDAQLLLTHHPLLFNPIGQVTTTSTEGRTVRELIRHDISFIAAHTNWDVARGGINDALAERLELSQVDAFGASAALENLKVVVFVPATHLDTVIDACSQAGAGIIGAYTRCAFYHEGTGTFLGGENANPTIGQRGQIEATSEMRLEMVCPASRQSAVSRAIRGAHPYEEPAMDFYRLSDRQGMPGGRIGLLPHSMTLTEFASHADARLGTRCWTWGDATAKVRKVAIVGGAADGEFEAARRKGADVFLTGEVKQHIALESTERGLPIVAAGHYATEHPGCIRLCATMGEKLPEVEWKIFEPQPGLAGRPL